MISWLKKHFIPHEGNEHRPHLLRRSGTRTIIITLLAIELIAFIIPGIVNFRLSGGMASVISAVLNDLTNETRGDEHLSTLTVNPLLTKAAEMKAEDMATKGYFAHTSPEGKTPWYWIDLAGYRYEYAGENLAVNFRDSKDVTDAWLHSPTHRANIVKGNYTEIGTGIARGMYKGRRTVFVAQVYANPLPLAKTGTLVSKIPVPQQPGNVLGAEAQVVPQEEPAFWQKLVAMPRITTAILMAIIFSIVAVALILYLIIKVRGHHPDLIVNGLTVLAVIGALFVVNYYASYGNMVITESYDYGIEDTV